MVDPTGNPKLHKICSGYIGTTICILGLIGNLISVAVWQRINKKRSDAGKSAGILLIVLAFVDSGLLVFFMLFESVQQLKPDVLHNIDYIRFFCYVGFPLYFFFIVASIWMVVCITYNRFIAVIFPHKAFHFNSLKVTYSMIAGTLVFSFIVNLPHFFNFKPVVDNSGKSQYQKTKYGKSEDAVRYDFVAHCMLLVLIPWVTIFVLNAIIIHKLVTKGKLHVIKKGESNRERQTTVILLVITISFLVFLLWQCLVQCFWMLKYGQKDKQIWFDVDSAYGFGRLGVVVNSSVNFVLYCLTGSMFRKEMCKIFYASIGKGYDRFDSTSNSRSFSSRPSVRSMSVNKDALSVSNKDALSPGSTDTGESDTGAC